MMIRAGLLIALLGATLAWLAAGGLATGASTPTTPPTTRAAYARFKLEHGRLLTSPAEDRHRLAVFADRLAFVARANARQRSYRLALNEFSDMEMDEVAARYFGLGAPLYSKDFDFKERFTPIPTPNPTSLEQISVDWSKMMLPVSRQGGCGACYAFSAVAALEHLQALKFGSVIKLSVQQAIDCSGDFDNAGCSGGWPHGVFAYALHAGGLARESDYPYQGKAGDCREKEMRPVSLPFFGHKTLASDRPSAVLQYLQSQTVTAAIAMKPLVHYSSGVFDESCEGHSEGHAVLIVGYGQEKGKPYWKVRNSWGEKWGEKGYFRIQRNLEDKKDSLCGITTLNTVPFHFSMD